MDSIVAWYLESHGCGGNLSSAGAGSAEDQREDPFHSPARQFARHEPFYHNVSAFGSTPVWQPVLVENLALPEDAAFLINQANAAPLPQPAPCLLYSSN